MSKGAIMKVTIDDMIKMAIETERMKIAGEICGLSKAVSQFTKSPECAAYNQALRDVVDRLEKGA